MGKRTGQLSTFRSKLEVSPSEDMGVLVVWVSAMDNLIGKEKQMTSSSDHSKTGNDILGCSAKIVDFNILRSVKKISSRIKPQNFVRADFILLRELFKGIQETTLEAKGIQEYQEAFRDGLLQAQEQSIHLSRKSSQHSKISACELLRELRCKKGT